MKDIVIEEFVKNSVLSAKIDPKVVMDLVKILLEEFMDENEQWFFSGLRAEIHSL